MASESLLAFIWLVSLMVQRQYWNLFFNDNRRINVNKRMVFMNTILVLPVMVSGLGMRPGRHLQIGFPSLHKTVKHQSFSCEVHSNFLLFPSVFSGSVTFWYGSRFGYGSSDPYLLTNKSEFGSGSESVPKSQWLLGCKKIQSFKIVKICSMIKIKFLARNFLY